VPQARSSGSKSSGTTSRSQTKRSSARKPAATKPAAAKRTTRKSTSASGGASRSRSSRSTGSASSRSAAAKPNGASAVDPRLDAVAQRIRKLNERIIEEGKSAGEATLSSYEKALKAIASTLERGPGKSDVEWISALATTQAKFLRDVTTAWTAAARGMLK
jgi:hypothetical protein